MTLQHCQFNRGVWQILESPVRVWAEERGPLDVITGSVFDRNADGQRDDDTEALKMTSRNHKTRVAATRAAAHSTMSATVQNRLSASRPSSRIDGIALISAEAPASWPRSAKDLPL